jgi:hypothetical protein
MQQQVCQHAPLISNAADEGIRYNNVMKELPCRYRAEMLRVPLRSRCATLRGKVVWNFGAPIAFDDLLIVIVLTSISLQCQTSNTCNVS